MYKRLSRNLIRENTAIGYEIVADSPSFPVES
jgi:hypothetical protein